LPISIKPPPYDPVGVEIFSQWQMAWREAPVESDRALLPSQSSDEAFTRMALKHFFPSAMQASVGQHTRGFDIQVKKSFLLG